MYVPTVVTVGSTGTLIWQTSTGVAPDPAFSTSGDQIFPASAVGDPKPIMVIIPMGTTLYIVGSAGAAIGSFAGIVGPATIPFNVIGNDSLYGAISGGGTVTVVVGRT